MQAAVRETVTRFGRLDALVNNAAVSANKPFAALTLAEWNCVLAVNLTGAFLCAKHAAVHLAQSAGAIVNIASTRAFMSEPDTEAYSASKGGIVALTHALALSLGPRVRVNCISPGWIDVSGWKRRRERRAAGLRATRTTASTPSAAWDARRTWRRWGGLSALCAEAGFITGANFIADGGMTRRMIYV